ncbi:MAG: methylmalonyl Co-A mutase-associated GTPase MeaB [Ignavibacteriae bacterium]|nr:methylmalonyl Co-A mutase-associated GTPase MeaB [Ignavibacteriota bacterium]
MELQKELIEKILSGDKRAVSRAITLIENNTPAKPVLLKLLYAHTGKAYRIGITGPPGAGKSTLTDCLIKHLNTAGYKTGVIAVDPTSPFTGGALLGDRVRMSESGLLKDVFIRSMATRGSLGGLSKNVIDACNVLDAAGKDFILIETVGVGQSELDIAQTADTTVVVLVPEAGDSIQAMKAGLMEIADVFALNKSDRAGADEIASGIRNMLHLKKAAEHHRNIDVIKTIASRDTGVKELFAEILGHKSHLEKTGMFDRKRKEHLMREITETVNGNLQKNFWDDVKIQLLNNSIESIYAKTTDPYTFAEELVKSISSKIN